MIDWNKFWNKLQWPREYPKPVMVVPDAVVEIYREAYPDAEVIPVSETRLPESES